MLVCVSLSRWWIMESRVHCRLEVDGHTLDSGAHGV
jgi:hypothetical protein